MKNNKLKVFTFETGDCLTEAVNTFTENNTVINIQYQYEIGKYRENYVAFITYNNTGQEEAIDCTYTGIIQKGRQL